MKPDNVKVNDVLYDCHKHQAGNTTMRVMGVWEVRILRIEMVDAPAPFRRFIVSWNGNSPEKYYDRDIEKLRKYPPEFYRYDVCGGKKCSYCCRREIDGHSETCCHPREVERRAKREKKP